MPRWAWYCPTNLYFISFTLIFCIYSKPKPIFNNVFFLRIWFSLHLGCRSCWTSQRMRWITTAVESLQGMFSLFYAISGWYLQANFSNNKYFTFMKYRNFVAVIVKMKNFSFLLLEQSQFLHRKCLWKCSCDGRRWVELRFANSSVSCFFSLLFRYLCLSYPAKIDIKRIMHLSTLRWISLITMPIL